MKFYWDTSAVINAAIAPAVFARLNSDEHVARMHVLSEFFSTMTGRGVEGRDANGQPVRVIFDAADAAKWLRGFADKVTFTELDAVETLDALDKAGSRVFTALAFTTMGTRWQPSSPARMSS